MNELSWLLIQNKASFIYTLEFHTRHVAKNCMRCKLAELNNTQTKYIYIYAQTKYANINTKTVFVSNLRQINIQNKTVKFAFGVFSSCIGNH